MPDEDRIPVTSEAGVVAARQAGRNLAEDLGFSTTEQTLIATAISEVARNIIQYAKCGEIVMCQIIEDGARGIQVVARDEGPGIPDVDRAMTDGYSTGKGMGLGLTGARRLMDKFHLSSEVDKGTVITMIKWAPGERRKRVFDG
ncbi:MAG: anti-sigma regulatory factor [Actinomycetota bacterium]